MEGNCYCCGKPGHRSLQCRHKSKPRSEWAINKTPELTQVQNLMTGTSTQQTQSDEASMAQQSNSNVSNPPQEWMGAQVQHELSIAQTRTEMKEWILLDSQSSVGIFCNPKLVEKIHDSGEALSVATNAGELITNKKATVPGYGLVWFDDRAMTNVFSLANMTKSHQVSFDSNKEDAFILHTQRGQIRFTLSLENLYYFKPTNKTNEASRFKNATNMVESVIENKNFFTKRQVERANSARRLLHTLGCPTVQDLKTIIRSNAITNCPITIEDINIDEKIYGKDVPSLKGKITRRKPSPVVHDMVEIPSELIEAQQNIDLCIDTMMVNNMPFLTTVSKRIKYQTAEFVPNKTMSAYRSALERGFNIYQSAGFRINTVSCDNEFKPLLEDMKSSWNFRPNYASAQEHVPEAERNNRVIEERIIAIYHSIPFNNLPRILIKALVMAATRKLNYFVPKGGVSAYYSPREILHQVKLDYQKHCLIPQFSYVIAHTEPQPKNTNASRGIDVIYIRPISSTQGGHEIMNLATGKIITRAHVTLIPITSTVINIVENMAKADGMTGLKLEMREDKFLYDPTSITGVNNENDEDEEVSNTNEEEGDTSEGEDDQDEINPNELGDLIDVNEMTIQKNRANSNYQHEVELIPQETDSADDMDEDEEIENNEDTEIPVQETLCQSQRTIKQLSQYTLSQYKKEPSITYDLMEAKAIAMIMCQFNERIIKHELKYGEQFVVTYSPKKGTEKFGEKARQACLNEMKQLYDRECFKPIKYDSMSPLEKKRALESLIFLTEKKDGSIKGSHRANGSPQREYMNREEVSSPTDSTESTLFTAVIEAEEGREVACCNIPNKQL